MYMKLLEQAVRELKGEELADDVRASVNLRVDLRIDDSYVPDMNQRLMIYRKVAGARTDGELDQILNELRDRYGAPPDAVEHLEQYGRIRILADRLGVESIDREGQTIVIKIRPDGKAERLNVERLIKVISARGDATLVPPATIKLDLRTPITPGPKGPDLRTEGPPRRQATSGAVRRPGPFGPGGTSGSSAPSRPGASRSWWTARATAGEVTAGFSKEEILKPPKEDPSAPGGVFARVKGFLSDLRVQ